MIDLNRVFDIFAFYETGTLPWVQYLVASMAL